MTDTEHLTVEAAEEVADALPSMDLLTFKDYMERATEGDDADPKEAAEYLEHLQELGIAILTECGKGILLSLPALQQFEQEMALRAQVEAAHAAEETDE